MTAGTASSRDHLRVLMTTDAVGGVWQYALDLAAGLVHHGAHVLLATLGPRPSAQQKHRALEIPGITLAESDFALEWMTNPWTDVDASGEWLSALEVEFGAHVIHLNGYSHGAVMWRKPVIVTAHSCVFSWWEAVHGSAPGPEWSEYQRRIRSGLAAANAIVAPSAYMAGALERHYGVAREKVRVIYNFSRAARSSRRLKQPFVLSAGRLWDEAKNIGLLNGIAPKLDWRIRVAGSERGPENSAGHANNLQVLGELPHADLIRQMDRASIFAHPALYEPFGLSILEAARAHCCLVLADSPSLRELWNGAAVFVDPRDPDAWLFELNALVRDLLKRQELGRLAHSRAGQYRASSSLGEYWNLYRSLIESARLDGKEVAA
ncbi:MAG TPA: glycosyltransferase family 4 protein [Bryobacteraceae bacterium]|nr:glycosyltransferase family 4 protein [Bryobacteraceae bacterium]